MPNLIHMTSPTTTAARRPFRPGLIRAALPASAVLLVVALLSPSSARAADDKVTFNDHVLPIFRNACNNCHNPDKKKAGLDLTSFSGVMAGSDGGSMASSGDPTGSQLYKVITHAAEPNMPPKRDKLPAAELEVVRKWIAGGMLENASGKAAAPSKPKLDLGTVAVVGKPTGPVAFPAGLVSEPLVHTVRPGAVESLAASPWAPVVAVGGQKQIILYHAKTAEVVGVLPFNEGVPRVLRFSSNGSLLLAAGGQGAKLGKVVLYDVATGNRLTDVGDELDEVLAADLSPDQKVVALGGPSRIVHAYDAGDGKELYSIKKHTDWVTAVAISPDGAYLATGDRAGNLYVWEAKDGGELYNLTGHKDAINAVAFRGDSKVLASVSKDGTLKLWDMAEGKQVKTADAHRGGATALAIAHDGRIVTAGKDKTVKVWDPAAGTPKTLAPGLTDLPMNVAFDDEGGRAFAGDWSGAVRVWQVGDGKDAKAEVKVVAELTPNPLKIADRLDLATKKVAEVEPAVAKAEAELKAVKEVADKAVADRDQLSASIEATKKAVADAQATVKAAETDGPAKSAAMTKAADRLAQAKKAVEQNTKAVATAEKALKDATAKAEKAALAAAAEAAAKPAGGGVAAADLKAAETDLKGKEQSLFEATQALGAAKLAANDKPNDQNVKAVLTDAQTRVGRRTQRVLDARAKAADLAKAVAAGNGGNGGGAVVVAPVAKVDPAFEKAVADAKAALEKAHSEVVPAEKSADEARAAVSKLNADRTAATGAVEKGRAALAEAEKQVKPRAAAAATAGDKVGLAMKALDAAKASAGEAKWGVAKLKSAQAGNLLAESKKALKQREDAKLAADQSAKDAVAAVEKAKADIAAFKKARDESPATLKRLTDGLPALRKALADAVVPAEASAKDQAEREALATSAAELVRKINEQAQKTKENPQPLADAEAAAKKVVESLAADLTVAKEKAARWAGAKTKAEGELATAEKAIAQEKSDTENAGKLTEGLKQALAAAEAEVPKKQAAAADAAKPIAEAKAKVDQVKAESDKLADEAAKAAPTPLAKG